MNDLLLYGLLGLLLIGLSIVAWRAKPRGPGNKHSRRSVLMGGPLGPGIYKGVDEKRSLERDIDPDSQKPRLMSHDEG